jgi:hypothetical protein
MDLLFNTVFHRPIPWHYRLKQCTVHKPRHTYNDNNSRDHNKTLDVLLLVAPSFCYTYIKSHASHVDVDAFESSLGEPIEFSFEVFGM